MTLLCEFLVSGVGHLIEVALSVYVLTSYKRLSRS